MPKTKKQLIFQAFQTMDISLLEMVLDDDKTYQDADKFTFIQKIEEAFDCLRSDGDTELIGYPGICGGPIEACENCGKKGKLFVGNRSKNYLSLIFEEENEEIKDIYSCYSLKTREEPEINRSISITIKKDERADFKPSNALLTFMIRTKNAVDELTQNPHQIIGVSIYRSWLKEHQSLYKIFKHSATLYRAMIPFHNLYKELQALDELVAKKEVFLKAVEEYRQLDKDSEMQRIKWIAKYERLYYDLLIGPLNLLVAYENGKDNKLDFFLLKGLKIELNLLKPCADFSDTFSPPHEEILGKYNLVYVADFLKKTDEKAEMENGLAEDDDLDFIPF